MISILIVLVAALLFSIRPFLTGRVIETNQYSYTTAICDENHYCEDYIIECEGPTLIKFTATGSSIQQESNWTDNRNETDSYCNRTN